MSTFSRARDRRSWASSASSLELLASARARCCSISPLARSIRSSPSETAPLSRLAPRKASRPLSVTIDRRGDHGYDRNGQRKPEKGHCDDASNGVSVRRVPHVREVLARRDAAAQIAVVLGAFAAYEVARHAMQPNWAQAFANARRIESVEQVLGVAWEQSLQRAFLAIPDLIQALNIFYFVGHFVFTAIFFIWLYRRSWDGFRSFRDAFLIATAISVVVHWLFPTAPPRLAGVGLEDTLLVLSGIDIGSPHSAAYSNPVAAVPSLHAAYALGVGIGLVRYGRSKLVRIAGVALSAARDPDDRRHGQPLRARRGRGDRRDRRRLPGRALVAGASPRGQLARLRRVSGIRTPFTELSGSSTRGFRRDGRRRRGRRAGGCGVGSGRARRGRRIVADAGADAGGD